MRLGQEVITRHAIKTLAFFVPSGTESRIVAKVEEGLYEVNFPSIGHTLMTEERE